MEIVSTKINHCTLSYIHSFFYQYTISMTMNTCQVLKHNMADLM